MCVCERERERGGSEKERDLMGARKHDAQRLEVPVHAAEQQRLRVPRHHLYTGTSLVYVPNRGTLLFYEPHRGASLFHVPCRGASLIRNSAPLRPYRKTKPWVLWWSQEKLSLISEVPQ